MTWLYFYTSFYSKPVSRWWFQTYFSPLPGEMVKIDKYLSNRLVQPPTSYFHHMFLNLFCFWCKWKLVNQCFHGIDVCRWMFSDRSSRIGDVFLAQMTWNKSRGGIVGITGRGWDGYLLNISNCSAGICFFVVSFLWIAFFCLLVDMFIFFCTARYVYIYTHFPYSFSSSYNWKTCCSCWYPTLL